MSSDDDETLGGDLDQRPPHQFSGTLIKLGRRFVGHDHAIRQQSAGNPDAHALSTGEIGSTFRNVSIKAAGQQHFIKKPDPSGRPMKHGAIKLPAIPADRLGQRARRNIDVR